MCAERGDSRNTTAAAISSGVVMRCPSGMRAVMSASARSGSGNPLSHCSIERRHHLGRHDGVDANAGRQQFDGPFAREREDAALGRRISGRAALPRHRDLATRCSRSRRATRFSAGSAWCVDGVDVDQIRRERLDERRGRSALEPDAVVHAGVVDDGVEAARCGAAPPRRPRGTATASVRSATIDLARGARRRQLVAAEPRAAASSRSTMTGDARLRRRARGRSPRRCPWRRR